MYENEYKKLFELAGGQVDEMDIILSESKSITIKAQKQKIESFDNSHKRGLGIRVLKDGKIGYSYTENFSDESMQLIVKEAIENSKIIEKEELSFFENYHDIPLDFEIYNPEIEKIDLEAKKQIALDMEKFAFEADKRVINVAMSIYSDSESYIKIANTKGLNKEMRFNYAAAYIYVIVSDGKDRRNALDYCMTNNFSEINAKAIAESAVKKSLDRLGRNELKSGKYNVVINNEAFASLLGTFWSVFSAKNVQEGKSLLKGKVNSQIAVESVNITDNGRIKDGIFSTPFDSEGFPTQETVLVENGILKSFLHNSVTAHKDGVSSTGNGSRSYKSSLDVSHSNLIFKPMQNKKEDLLCKFDELVEIVSFAGLHSGTSVISGDFSLSCEGFLYKNGQRSGSLAPFTISGNFLELLNNIELIADDLKYSSSAVATPSILVLSQNLSS